MTKTKVAVTGTGSVIGQAIIKSIKHSEISDRISIIGFDYFADTVGSYWVDKNYILPDILKNNTKCFAWWDIITDVLNKENVRILFPGLDFELDLLTRYKITIEEQTNCTIMISPLNCVNISNDKYKTYTFLKNVEANCPETLLFTELINKEVKFPCIIKPRIESRSRGVFIIPNKKELDWRLSGMKQSDKREIIIQELIGTPDNEYTCGVIYLDNEIKDMIVLKRILKDGNTIEATYSKDTPKVIYDYIREVTQALKPFGAANLQLQLDSNGIPKIFEINARHSGTTYFRALFGFKEVEYIINYIMGWENKEFKLKEGTIKRYFDEMYIKKE